MDNTKIIRLFKSLSWVEMVAALTITAGLLTVLRPIGQRLPERVTDVLIPIEKTRLSFFIVGFGLALMYLGFELLQRKRAAWLLAVVLSVLNLIFHIVVEPQFLPALITFLALAALFITRQQFKSGVHAINLWQALKVLVGSIVFALAYGTIGFWFLDKRDLGITFSFWQSVVRTLRSYLLIGNSDLAVRTHYGRWFLQSLALVGTLTLAYILFNVFRPLRYRLRTLPAERARARLLLERYGGEVDDFFKLWPLDKAFFFSSDGQAFLAYNVAQGVALCFAGPVGPPKSASSLLKDFKEFCLANGWLIAFAQATVRYDRQFKAAGFNRLLIGADAVVNLERFVNQTSQNKYFRNITNRFQKQKFETNRYLPPHSPSLLQEVKAVSESWLGRAGRKQWRVFTGYFSRRYLQQTALFTVRNRSGQMMAFTNELPCYKPGEATVDLMRHRQQAPSNIMDFLFTNLMRSLYQEGYKKFNLGLSQLASKNFADKPSDKLLSYLYGIDQKIISFKGLHQYKSKFEPDWEPRYLYYQGTAARLPQIGLAAAKLIKY